MKFILKITKMVIGIIASLIGMLVLIGFIFLYTSPEFGNPPSNKKQLEYKASPNFQDGKFQNTISTNIDGDIDYIKTLKGFFKSGNKKPSAPLPLDLISTNNIETLADSITRMTWFGHSSLFLEMEGKKIFVDPMLTKVPSPHPLLGSSRFNDSLPLSIDDIPQLDAVLITHDHYDHLDYKSIKKLKHKVAHFYVPLGVDCHLISWGVSEEKITALDWWDTASIASIKLTAAPARHFSGRGITDRTKTQWCSWIVEGTTHKLYFSGDSGYAPHFKEIGNKYGPFDIAFLECGQYDEQWSEIHMMPEETVQAAIEVQAKVSVPIHWGAFMLALHDWDDPVKRFTAAAEEQHITIATPRIGQPIVIDSAVPQSDWWK